MKKQFVILFVAMSAVMVSAAPLKSYLDYIAQWKDVALQHEKEFGIPASITLAQGLLESGAGSSELARNANNHFGIKCTSEWKGETYRHDDETEQECFRSYTDAADSYRDHALFLKRSRYASLYEIPVENYQAWARGLKDCGYATDPKYPEKLVRIIEDYGLFDLEGSGDNDGNGGIAVPVVPAEGEQQSADEKTEEVFFSDATSAEAGASPSATSEVTAPSSSKKQKPVIVSRPETIATITSNPEEEPKEPLSAMDERKMLFLTHQKQSTNGCTYIVAQEGDTWANVAFRLNVKERTLRINNDALGRDMAKGDYIFLHKKAMQGPKEKALLWVHPGETIWMVAQREGIQEKYIRKYNGFGKKVNEFKTRQTILLRKKVPEN